MRNSSDQARKSCYTMHPDRKREGAYFMDLSRDLEIIALQERELQFRSFNADLAWQLGLRLRELAASRSASVVIDVRRFVHPLFYAALAGSSPDNCEWVRIKGKVFAPFNLRSYELYMTYT